MWMCSPVTGCVKDTLWASERHPLVGDELYGTPRPCGLMLHAHSVSFTHPVTGEHIHIEAPCPWEP